MPRRFIILLAAAVILAALAAAVFIGVRRRSEPAPVNGGANANATPTAVPTTPAAEPREQDPELVAIVALAKNYAERYGSYATENTLTNLEELLPWMTAQLRAETERDLVRARREPQAKEFLGITTKALSPAVASYTKGKSATVEVGTQRTEQRGTATEPSYRQTLTLTIVLEDGAWKVARHAWKPKESG